ncbi:MAG TPA: DUF503 domain-containing protein [Longimicrobiales bacterium]|nr:DUF503 domain-containing protein [Longimicrobiales bacterium]
MVVGLAVWDMQLPGCHSLKEKRSVLKSLKDRMHNQFNVSAAETAHQNAHQRAELAACVVSADRSHANSVLDVLDRFLEMEARVRIVDSYTTYY